jgi:hypothetical protein
MSFVTSPRKHGQILGMLEAGLSQCAAVMILGVNEETFYRTLQREKFHFSQGYIPRTSSLVAMDTRNHG